MLALVLVAGCTRASRALDNRGGHAAAAPWAPLLRSRRAELRLDAGGIRSARQWMSEDGTTDVVLGAHRLPPRPALTTAITSL